MRKADNLPPSCAVVTKSGNFNFLEPSGPVQACNRTALPYKDKLQNCSCNQFHYIGTYKQVEKDSMTRNRGGNNGSDK